MNAKDDLSFEEIRLFSLSVGSFSRLLLSGGEPFLREDLCDILNIFVEKNKVKFISIPTNGINTERILFTTEKILNSFKDKNVKVSINPSVDALEYLNAKLRGRADAFSSAILTIKKLGELKKKYINLEIAVNTVFSNDNRSEIVELIKEINKFNFIDFHNIEVVRPVLFDAYSKFNIDTNYLKKIHLFMTILHETRIKKRVSASNGLIQWLKQWRRLIGQIGHIRYMQVIKEKFLCGRKNLFNCPAGQSVCVIESNGDVKLCELREPVGNLRDNGYNIQAILNSTEAQRLRGEIKKSKCSCTHICFIDEYIHARLKKKNIIIIFKIIYFYLKFVLFESNYKIQAI